MTREEALRIARDLVDYRATCMVACGRALAQYVLDRLEPDMHTLTNDLFEALESARQLRENKKLLCDLLESIRAASPDARDDAIAAAVTACKGMF